MFKLLFILILLFFPTNGNNYFCKLNCGNENNTACAAKGCKISPDCGPNAIALPFDKVEQTVILDLHNMMRNEIARGIDPRFLRLTAANMHVLNYDKELAYVAQCWTNACGWMKHQFNDVCKKTSKFEKPGQNIFRYSIKRAPKKYDVANLTSECINEWYSGINTITEDIIDLFNATENEMTKRHYTQFMWAKNTHVGCGRTEFTINGSHYLSLVCNYGPGGNIIGKPVYKRGNPCSDCKPDMCSTKYKGLCGEVNDLDSDKWKPPGGALEKSKCSKLGGHFYNVLPLLYLPLRYI